MNIIKKVAKSLIRQQWNIGITETPLKDIVEGKEIVYHWMIHDFPNRWFADPFILDVTDTHITVLAEDYEEKDGYAKLSKLLINRKTMRLEEVCTILDEGSHMSYPVIICEDRKIYVMPENCASGSLNLYQFDDACTKLSKISTISEEPWTDATPLNYKGKSYIFTTQLPDPNGCNLHIYTKEDGEYQLSQLVGMSSKKARMAGNFFIVDDTLYRPAQDSNKYYGGALIIQKVTNVGGEWFFEDVQRLTSPHPEYQTGLHTLNSYKGISVVDIHGYCKHPWLSSMLVTVINRFRTLR